MTFEEKTKMKKATYINPIVGIIFIILSLVFYFKSGNEPSPVDEFNIYWMFTLSALGLGGLLVVTESRNSTIQNGSRVLHLITLLFSFIIIFSKETGSASYFPYAFLIFGALSYLKLPFINHKKAVVLLSRIFIGSLFIVSGLIKANDPLGFAYKLEDYFTDTALGPFWTNFFGWSLFLSILISASEIVLGLAVLFGGKSKLASWTLLAMALFFAWLTWFTATCVDDQTAYGDKHMKESTAIEEKYKSKYDNLAKEYEGYYEYINDSDDNFSPDELIIIQEIRVKVAEIDVLKKKDEDALGEFGRTCVDDCGCFGDAMKGSVGRSLTPWESFYKDICLLFFVIVLLLNTAEVKLNYLLDDILIIPISLILIGAFAGGLFSWYFPLYFTIVATVLYFILKKYHWKKIGAEWSIAIAMSLLSIGFALYCLWYLPVKDFRPYAIGNNLIEQRTSIQPELKFYYKLKDKKTGEEKEFEQFPENWDTEYDYISARNVVIKEGVDAPARDFSITEIKTNREVTDSVLKLENVIMVVAYDLRHTNKTAFEKVNDLAAEAKKANILFVLLTASDSKVRDSVAKEMKLNFDFYSADEKVQKAIIRSNPGVLLIQKAVVKNKWSAASIPDFETIKNN